MSAKRLLWLLVLLVGAGAAAGILALRSASQASPSADAPAATWAAGARRAPAFRLRDENGKPVSLASYRGGPVLVTFVDPLCRDYCPLEAARLMDVARATHTPIVAVSTNPYGNARATLREDGRKWHLTSNWRWAVGTLPELASVWRAYHIAVLITKSHDVTHTLGAYVVDSTGDERALFLWPFRADSVVHALRAV